MSLQHFTYNQFPDHIEDFLEFWSGSYRSRDIRFFNITELFRPYIYTGYRSYKSTLLECCQVFKLEHLIDPGQWHNHSLSTYISTGSTLFFIFYFALLDIPTLVFGWSDEEPSVSVFWMNRLLLLTSCLISLYYLTHANHAYRKIFIRLLSIASCITALFCFSSLAEMYFGICSFWLYYIFTGISCFFSGFGIASATFKNFITDTRPVFFSLEAFIPLILVSTLWPFRGSSWVEYLATTAFVIVLLTLFFVGFIPFIICFPESKVHDPPSKHSIFPHSHQLWLGLLALTIFLFWNFILADPFMQRQICCVQESLDIAPDLASLQNQTEEIITEL